MLTTAPWALALGFALGAHAGWFCPGHQHAPVVEVVKTEEAVVVVDDDDPCTQSRRARSMERLLALGRKVHRTSETIAVPRELFTALTEDPWMLERFGRAKLVTRDGVAVGFRVSLFGDGGLLGELALRNGDLITHIDGRRLESTADLREALERLLGSNDVSVTVQRRGYVIEKRYLVE